jgi:hypothetical protein
MGPHSRQNLGTAHVIPSHVLFLKPCKVHGGPPPLPQIVFSLTCYNNSSHSGEPSASHTFFFLFLSSLLFKSANQENDELGSLSKNGDNMTPFLFIAELKMF